MTALNPLLARHTVFVHQYPFDFLVTALFLLAAVTLFDNTSRVDPRRFAKVALAAGIAPLFSVPSVLLSFPIMHVGALGALRDWRLNRSRALSVLGATIAYDLAVLACYVLLRSRTNERIREGNFAYGFMPLDSLSGAGSFLATNGRWLLEMGQSEAWLPFIGLGCIWLLARRPWRTLGLVVVGFYAVFLLASALEVYPLGTGRPDIFAFPVSILLLASGAHLATAALPAVRLFRFAIAALVVTVVLVWPPHPDYHGNPRNDRRLVEALAANERPDDGIIMTWPAGFLTAFYGQWPFEIAAYDRAPNRTQVKISRTNTLHLPRRRRDSAEVRPGEATQGPTRAAIPADFQWSPRVVRGFSDTLLRGCPRLRKHLRVADTPSTKCSRPAKERCFWLCVAMGRDHSETTCPDFGVHFKSCTVVFTRSCSRPTPTPTPAPAAPERKAQPGLLQ